MTGSVTSVAKTRGMQDEPRGGCVVVASGALAAERFVLDAVAAENDRARREPARLAQPLRIVVPSRSLREHLGAALVSRFGAIVGVRIQTLFGVALEIVERSGGSVRPGDRALGFGVRAFANREPVLAERFANLQDGYGALIGPVRDLLDAGLSEATLPAVVDAVEVLAVPAPERERVAALVRVAAAVCGDLEAQGLDARGVLLRRALDALEAGGDFALPARAVFVHGFADATGVATDLLVGLVRRKQACIVLDRPPDPTGAGGFDAGAAFTQRFLERVAAAAKLETLEAHAEPPRLVLRRAPGRAAEVRRVALDLRGLLDSGERPESIAIVARTLGPYLPALRDGLSGLGIPFSTSYSTEGRNQTGLRFAALVELLERGLETSTDRWLDALWLGPEGVAAELRLALHVLGCARLGHVAGLESGEFTAGVELPGVGSPNAGEPPPREGSVRRLACHVLDRAIERARAARALLGDRPAALSTACFVDRVRVLALDALGWADDPGLTNELVSRLDGIGRELPDSLVIDAGVGLGWLADAFGEVGAEPAGGSGGGVALLDAMEARGRTFSHLFVVGMNRDVFPRIVIEDPLFSDGARAGLSEFGRGVLADLPLKLGGFDEERHLFAALLSASPSVVLSWLAVDDEGRERAPSVFVETLRLARPELRVETLATPWSERDPESLRSSFEHAARAALRGRRASFARLLPLALEEALDEFGMLAARFGAPRPPVDAASLARARLAALRLLEPSGADRERPGAGLGLVGPRRGVDGAGRRFSVTLLESIARCPWRAYLERVLGLAPPPDALDALPDLDARLIGNALHRSVEKIVAGAIGRTRTTLARACETEAALLPWPPRATLEAIARAEAKALLREEGRHSRGLEHALAERIAPLLDRTRELLFRLGAPALFGAELDETIEIRDATGNARELYFRADLAIGSDEGTALVDLKTGAPFSDATQAKTIRKHLLRGIAKGRWLQAAAYARVANEGRYLFVDTEKSGCVEEVSVEADDPASRAAFEASTGALVEAWDLGAFVPRLVIPEGTGEKLPCDSCEVREACAYGDGGARHRLGVFGASAAGEADESLPPLLRAARRMLRLPLAQRSGQDPEEEEE